jgi:voltage-gated potassium channel
VTGPSDGGSRADTGASPGPPDVPGMDTPRSKPVRRRAARALLSSGLVSILVVAAYFLLPFSSTFTNTTLVLLVVGLFALSVLLAWHLRSIMRSPYPRIRAVAALATTLPIFLVLFATTYFVMSRASLESFSEPLSRLDSAYFTITVFSTVGFGDITPVTQTARTATMVQMIGDVVLVGLVAQVIVGAVRQGVRRRDAHEHSDEER